jgi:hypothetical protein
MNEMFNQSITMELKELMNDLPDIKISPDSGINSLLGIKSI